MLLCFSLVNMKLAVIISPNYKDYAKRFLRECLDSLRSQTIQDYKIFLVDNETSKESFEYLQQAAPEAHIIALEKNEGFAGGNNRAMEIAMKENFDYCVLINMDTMLEKDCLEKWCEAAKQKPEAAIQARLMMWPEQTIINSLGNLTHFLGFGYSNKYREKYNGGNSLIDIVYPSGAAVMLPIKVLKKVGLFDEVMWMYNEDQDLGWRFWLAGYSCVLAPEVVVYHKYEFSRSIAKYYWMDRNRVIAILKNYHWLTLIFIAPAFIIMELGLILFSLKSGWFKEKLKVWQYFFIASNWNYILKERKKIQSTRKISDRKATKFFSGRIWYQEINNPLLNLLNPIFSLYWRLVRLIMFW